MPTSSRHALAQEIAYTLHQVLTLYPSHPLAAVFTCVSEDGAIERTCLSESIATWSSQLRHHQSHSHALFFQKREHTQRLLLQRGVASALLGTPEQARQDLHALLQHAQGGGKTHRRLEGLAYLVLAVLATQQERYPDALPLWKQAQAWLQPHEYDHVALTWHYAKVLIELKHVRKAHSVLTQILTPATPDSHLPQQEERANAYAELYAQRSGVRSLLGYHQEAIDNLNRALELTPTCARFFSIRGLLHARQQHWQAAYQDLWRALHDMPGDQELAACFLVVLQCLGAQLVTPATHTKGNVTALSS
ncbi:tetratricopeptide repeat protein [Ktedonobacter racemifer]|uniref:Uncharacterized protein n=1 Tax=Ktedonobacter racemifer DSM 44963 TaxID=485913 RepID=D6TXZ7_KTERA|nr:tetratricopeptide repeat protein [Ktedonobacter racemifer]EFH84993.1 hypothetical protein Krac_6125 [Ktedonobacter racemifer DSM 44963]